MMDVHRSFAAIHRPLSRHIVGMQPAHGSAAYAHAERPASRCGCGNLTEEQNAAMYPASQPRRGPAGVGMRFRGSQRGSSFDELPRFTSTCSGRLEQHAASAEMTEMLPGLLDDDLRGDTG